MSPEEALAALGLDGGADRQEIRRAYLRRIKQCKPEVLTQRPAEHPGGCRGTGG